MSLVTLESTQPTFSYCCHRHWYPFQRFISQGAFSKAARYSQSNRRFFIL